MSYDDDMDYRRGGWNAKREPRKPNEPILHKCTVSSCRKTQTVFSKYCFDHYVDYSDIVHFVKYGMDIPNKICQEVLQDYYDDNGLVVYRH